MLRQARTLLRSATISGALILAAVPVTGQDNGDDDRVGAGECCLSLLIPTGARATALGNALTARGGADALFVNPAGLAALERDEFRIHNAPTEIETTNTFGVAFRIRSAGIVALNYRMIDLGSIEGRDETGQPTGEIRFYNHMLLASFATRLGGGVAAGITYMLYQERETCKGFCERPSLTATTHGVDFGVQYHPPIWPSLQLGASITHFALPLQVINAEQAAPTPARIRAGAAYEVLHHFSADSAVAVWLSSDVAVSWRQDVPLTWSGGAEAVLDETIFVRIGYATGSGRDAGAAVGLGLRYERFDVGVAKSFDPSGLVRDPYQITFAVSF